MTSRWLVDWIKDSSTSFGIRIKECYPKKLTEAIHLASIGKIYMTFDVAKTLHAAEHKTPENIVLGRREKEVLELIKDGYTNGEIATQLNLSIYTVDTYRKSLLSKLDARNTADLIRKAFQHKLIRLE